MSRALALAVTLALALPVAAAEKLLTVHKLSDTFGIYDPVSGVREASIAVGHKPHEFALSADRRFAFVTDYGADTYTETQPGGDTITVIDLTTRVVVARISTGEYHRPHGIERAPSGRFYVTTDLPAAILIVDGAARRVQRVIPIQGKLPHMLQLSHDEQWAYTANAGSADVSVVSLTQGKEVARIETGGVPMGFALTRDGKRLYLATRTNNRIVRIDTARRAIEKTLDVDGQPVRLLLSPDGKSMLATLIGGAAVALIDTSTFKEVRRVAAGARPEGMTLDPAGKFVYVSAQSDNKVLKLNFPALTPALEILTENKPDPLLIWQQP